MHFTLVFLVAAAVVYGANAAICPTCSNENDYTTCTGQQNCQAGHDTCETRIDLRDNKIDYHCSEAQSCTHQQTQNSCDNAGTNGHCVICCNSLADCRAKRDDYFMFG
ncbi:unnamed protein product [Lymnaea stagnalis]|uniref:Uncharacterized protein n=1 Tax=Lymnaea stagnalis TaxID=6523 RepID=A0AAV2HHD1_LYMST